METVCGMLRSKVKFLWFLTVLCSVITITFGYPSIIFIALKNLINIPFVLDILFVEIYLQKLNYYFNVFFLKP